MYSELLKYAKTYGPLKDDYYEWHKNRPKYGIWMLELADSIFLERFDNAQQYLSHYLMSTYQRKPHITLAVCGFMASQKVFWDDYDQRSLQQDIDQILAMNLQKIVFTIDNRLISYAIAPGFKVLDDHGTLSALHQKLTKVDSEKISYFPHVTVGLYNDEWPTEEIVRQLKAFDVQENIILTADVIKLASYVPTEAGGALKDELTIHLQDQSITQYSKLF